MVQIGNRYFYNFNEEGTFSNTGFLKPVRLLGLNPNSSIESSPQACCTNRSISTNLFNPFPKFDDRRSPCPHPLSSNNSANYPLLGCEPNKDQCRAASAGLR